MVARNKQHSAKTVRKAITTMLIASQQRLIVDVFRHHPFKLAMDAGWCIVLILLAIAGMVLNPLAPLLALWYVIEWYTTTYSVTSNRDIICRKWLFGSQVNTIPLFGEVVATKTMQGQLLDYGDVTIRQPGGTSYLRRIGNFKDFQLCLEDSSGLR